MDHLIFLSYRRSYNFSIINDIYLRLIKELLGHNIFIDRVNIIPGDNFHKSIEESLYESTVLLALIGKGWGNKIRRKNDYVRKELEIAKSRGIRIIPVYLDNYYENNKLRLPKSLDFLHRTQGVLLYENGEYEKLIYTIKNYLKYIDTLESINRDEYYYDRKIKSGKIFSMAFLLLIFFADFRTPIDHKGPLLPVACATEDCYGLYPEKIVDAPTPMEESFGRNDFDCIKYSEENCTLPWPL
ncbi:MAG: toll/interleukin-1 receptor domain-containing protein [Bacteroidota bacterium]